MKKEYKQDQKSKEKPYTKTRHIIKIIDTIAFIAMLTVFLYYMFYGQFVPTTIIEKEVCNGQEIQINKNLTTPYKINENNTKIKTEEKRNEETTK